MRIEELRTWLKQKLCSHSNGSEFVEVKNVDKEKDSLSAFHQCVSCGEVLHVEYSWYVPRGSQVILPERITKPSRRL